MCIDDCADPEAPFFFMYATVFKRLKLRLPFTRFERALLTEVNMALAQLGLCLGLRHPLQPLWPYAISGCLLVLL